MMNCIWSTHPTPHPGHLSWWVWCWVWCSSGHLELAHAGPDHGWWNQSRPVGRPGPSSKPGSPAASWDCECESEGWNPHKVICSEKSKEMLMLLVFQRGQNKCLKKIGETKKNLKRTNDNSRSFDKSCASAFKLNFHKHRNRPLKILMVGLKINKTPS